MSAAASSPVLVVEDRDSLRRLLQRALEESGYDVVAAACRSEAERALGERSFDVVLTDLKLPDGDGLDVLRAAGRLDSPPPVVVMTAHGSVAAAVEAMKLGAIDFLEKPVEVDELRELVASLIKRGGQGHDQAAPPAFEVEGAPPIVGEHPALRASLRLLRKVAPTEGTVLLLGESGTGKELFARALHGLSPRRAGPFVAINCAAIPESLIENELFGHEKGAFTGASSRQAGRFEQAARGTLLLDEIGELSEPVQAKVLRVLEERTFERVGSGLTVKADVRLVAATNRDLSRLVAEGRFRADLFYRLEVFPIELPALRERASDIPLLVRHLAARAAERHALEQPVLSSQALDLLAGQEWPGNVRQLSNVVERAVILSEDGTVGRAELEELIEPLAKNDEREQLKALLLETNGDKHAAAQRLGVSYRTVQRRIRQYDLEGFPQYRG